MILPKQANMNVIEMNIYRCVIRFIHNNIIMREVVFVCLFVYRLFITIIVVSATIKPILKILSLLESYTIPDNSDDKDVPPGPRGRSHGDSASVQYS